MKFPEWIANRWFVLSLRLIVGALFIYAGALKIADPLAFADSIATFKLLPPSLINLLALALPPFEVIAGGMIIVGFKTRAAALALLALTVVFAIALSQGLVRGLEIDCGCLGSGKPSVAKTWFSLGRDLLLLAACALIYRHCLRSAKTEYLRTG